MKIKLHFCILLLFFSFQQVKSQVFTWKYPKTQGNPVFGFAVKNELSAWGLGASGELIRTNDAGFSWNLVQSSFQLMEKTDFIISTIKFSDLLYRLF